MTRSLTERAMDVAVRRSLDWLDLLSRYEQASAAAELAIRAESLAQNPLRLTARVMRAAGRPTTADRRREAELAARATRDPRWRQGAQYADEPVFWHDSRPGTTETAKPARTVLLLNGWTASGLLWPDELLEQLGKQHVVIRVDNRGTGWSRTASAPFTIADLADDAARVLARTDAGPAVVLGYSMGGMIAQELALRHPGLVKKLVLVATRPPAPTQILPAPHVVLPMLQGPQGGETFDAYLGHLWSYQTGVGFADRKPEVLAELVRRQMERPTPRIAAHRQMQAIAAWHGSDRLRRLNVPTEIVHGATDAMMPIGNGLKLARLIAGSRFHELQGVGHLVPFEAPTFLADLVGAT